MSLLIFSGEMYSVWVCITSGLALSWPSETFNHALKLNIVDNIFNGIFQYLSLSMLIKFIFEILFKPFLLFSILNLWINNSFNFEDYYECGKNKH